MSIPERPLSNFRTMRRCEQHIKRDSGCQLGARQTEAVAVSLLLSFPPSSHYFEEEEIKLRSNGVLILSCICLYLCETSLKTLWTSAFMGKFSSTSYLLWTVRPPQEIAREMLFERRGPYHQRGPLSCFGGTTNRLV